jgi:hypothetical protein
MYIRSLINLFKAWPAKMLGLFLLILFIWASCVLLEILIDPNFPDDIPVNHDRVTR